MSDIVEEARALLKQHSRIHAMHDSDPAKDVDVAGMIEALADEVDQLRDLVVHMHVHSGYPKNGYMQMTTEQKALYDTIWERSVAELDAEEASHAKP